MTATSEDRHEDRPAVTAALSLLSVLVGFVAVCAFTWAAGHWFGLLFTKPVGQPSGWRGLLAMNLLICAGAIWGLLRLKRLRTAVNVLGVLLLVVALFSFSLAENLVKVQLRFGWPWPWQVKFMVAVDLLVGVGAIGGLLWLKPWSAWKGSGEPVSPRTRRTHKLFWLSIAVVAVSTLGLILGTTLPNAKDMTFGTFFNSPVSPAIAMFAITGWLVGMAINKWWWYFSADEHERRADDFGNLLGWALFLIVTPAWWVAARAGLLPQPNAMVLWLVAGWVSAIGYFWRRT
jgi:hypothetical protein